MPERMYLCSMRPLQDGKGRAEGVDGRRKTRGSINSTTHWADAMGSGMITLTSRCSSCARV